MSDLTDKELAQICEKSMRCNCDLDNWQPERDTGHSWVCRIHKRVKSIRRGDSALPETQSEP